jgi:hypothetical protein
MYTSLLDEQQWLRLDHHNRTAAVRTVAAADLEVPETVSQPPRFLHLVDQSRD